VDSSPTEPDAEYLDWSLIEAIDETLVLLGTILVELERDEPLDLLRVDPDA
jgi:hypothetical protein